MHGTFGEILRCEGIRALEDRLEQYFNMWAWQWDLGASDLTLPFGELLVSWASVLLIL